MALALHHDFVSFKNPLCPDYLEHSDMHDCSWDKCRLLKVVTSGLAYRWAASAAFCAFWEYSLAAAAADDASVHSSDPAWDFLPRVTYAEALLSLLQNVPHQTRSLWDSVPFSILCCRQRSLVKLLIPDLRSGSLCPSDKRDCASCVYCILRKVIDHGPIASWDNVCRSVCRDIEGAQWRTQRLWCRVDCFASIWNTLHHIVPIGLTKRGPSWNSDWLDASVYTLYAVKVGRRGDVQ